MNVHRRGWGYKPVRAVFAIPWVHGTGELYIPVDIIESLSPSLLKMTALTACQCSTYSLGQSVSDPSQKLTLDTTFGKCRRLYRGALVLFPTSIHEPRAACSRCLARHHSIYKNRCGRC